MKLRKTISFVLVILGVIVFLFSMYAKHRVNAVKSTIHNSSGLFSDNPVNKQIGKVLEDKVGSYDKPILFAMIGGVVLVVIGVGTFLTARKR